MEKLGISQDELKQIQAEAAKTNDKIKKSETANPEKKKKKKDFVIKKKNSAFGAALMKALGDGDGIEFNEDEEYSSGFLNTEKKLLGLDIQKSKKKRKKNTLLLSEQNTILPEQTTVSAESEPVEISVDDIEFSEAAVADEENDDCAINDEIIINSDEITVLDETEVI